MKLVSDDPRLQKDGPFRKFYLIKQYGQMLRDKGIDPNKLSCKQIEALIIKELTA